MSIASNQREARINGAPEFWMGGIRATDLLEVTEDPNSLEDGNFWAVLSTFEGACIFARFATVRDEEFPLQAYREIDGEWSSTHNRAEYIDYVERVRGDIELGNVYQVNACRTLSTPYKGDLRGLFSQMISKNPATFATYLSLPTIELACASPERFISRDGDRLVTSPIKGTAPLDAGNFGEKDQSENLMIVDLMRNDVSSISAPGSVRVTELFRTELHPGLKHLVSDVETDLLPGITWKDILQTMSPPGSVSGAPKSSALRIIAENEGARGPYCGFIGWVHGQRAELAVTIRTFWKTGEALNFGTGAGITWGSDAAQEWDETELKAENLIRIAGGRR